MESRCSSPSTKASRALGSRALGVFSKALGSRAFSRALDNRAFSRALGNRAFSKALGSRASGSRALGNRAMGHARVQLMVYLFHHQAA